MSKSNVLEAGFLALLFNGTTFDNIAEDASSSPLTDLYVSLHTSNPGEAGDQETNEVTYTDYARVAVPRDGTGWTVTGSSVSPADDIDFPESASDGEVATHFGIGTDSTGAGRLLYKGPLSPSVQIEVGTIPQLSTGTMITED